ncbi:transposable element Tcb2 transposase [Trichonephila clavipes]|nr:transposable element Tcb2 transposase [Trichonephila clavipes]
MEVPLRTAYGQNGRCGMQPKAKHKSSRAGAAKTRTETCEIVEEKQKLLDIREKRRTRETAESDDSYPADDVFRRRGGDDFSHVIPEVWANITQYRPLLCLVPVWGADRFHGLEDFGKRKMLGKRAKRHFTQLSEFERGLIIGMKTAGWSTRRVAGQVDRSECAVRNRWEQWTREGTQAWKTGSGATRKTTRREDRAASTCGPHSDSFNEANLKFKRPYRALPLKPEHRQLRLKWCQARSMWNVTDWQNVVFSDESRFVLGTDDNRVRVWRHAGPFLNGLPGAIFYQDNARPHTARVSQDFLRHFQTLPWQARSPDLSPVEHVLDQLKRQMPSCDSVHDL